MTGIFRLRAPRACAAPWRRWRLRQSKLPGSRVAGRAPPSRAGAGGRRAGPVGCLCGAPPAAGLRLLWPGGLPPTQARDAGAGTGLQGRSGRCCCVSVSCVFGKCCARPLPWHFRHQLGEPVGRSRASCFAKPRCFTAYCFYACCFKIVKPQLCVYKSGEFGHRGG